MRDGAAGTVLVSVKTAVDAVPAALAVTEYVPATEFAITTGDSALPEASVRTVAGALKIPVAGVADAAKVTG